MSYGMRSSDYFSKYSDRLGSVGGKRYGGGSSFSQFRDREERFPDTYSRPNSSNFGNRMGGGGGGFSDRRSTGKGMQSYDMGGYDDMRGRAEYSDRVPRSPLMRGLKRNMSPGSGFGGRSQGGMGMSDNFSTEAALLSLGLQAKQLLETQAAGYGPPAPKMRRLNEGYGRPMVQGRGGMMRRGLSRGVAARGRRGSGREQFGSKGLIRPMARGRGRGMARGGAARGRRGSGRVQKPREIPAWRKTPYHCNFCKLATKTREAHATHLKTKEHRAAVKEREQKLVDQMYSLHQRAQDNAEQARQGGLLVRFCGICSLEYTGKVGPHKSSRDHTAMMGLKHVKCPDCVITLPNRVQYERHNVTLLHIKNHMYNLIEAKELAMSDEELECPEEYDEEVSVGMSYVNRKRAVYCMPCNTYFSFKDIKVFDHCKSKEHFDNFKVFVEIRKAELEEKAKKAEEAAAVKEEDTDKNDDAAEADGEADKDEAVDGEADEAVDGEADEAVDGEADEAQPADEEAEDEEEAGDAEADGEAEDAQGVDEQAPAEENEDVEMAEAEEEEAPAKSPKKSPAAATRTTRKRSVKAK